MILEHIAESNFQRTLVEFPDQQCYIAQRLYDLCEAEFRPIANNSTMKRRIWPPSDDDTNSLSIPGLMVGDDKETLMFFITNPNELGTTKSSYRIRIEKIN